MGISAIARYGLLCVSILSAVVSAATSTGDDTSAACVSTTAAASTATWAIDYTAAEAPTTGTGYDIDSAFEAAYAFNSTMVSFDFLVESHDGPLLGMNVGRLFIRSIVLCSPYRQHTTPI